MKLGVVQMVPQTVVDLARNASALLFNSQVLRLCQRSTQSFIRFISMCFVSPYQRKPVALATQEPAACYEQYGNKTERLNVVAGSSHFSAQDDLSGLRAQSRHGRW